VIKKYVENAKKNIYTVRSQKNCAVSKVNKKFISHLTRAKRKPSAAANIENPVEHNKM
jgi:hypothetical protein